MSNQQCQSRGTVTALKQSQTVQPTLVVLSAVSEFLKKAFACDDDKQVHCTGY